MIRLTGRIALNLMLAAVAAAQTGTTYNSLGGFGNVLYPGTGHAPNNPKPGGLPPGFARQLGRTAAGAPTRPARVNHTHGGGAVLVPYPVVVGNYGYGGYYDSIPAQQQSSAPTASTNSVPSVVINQTFVQERPAPAGYQPEPQEQNSGMRVYNGLQTVPQPEPARASADQPTFYLIAFNDNRIVPALGYWLEGGNLHYVTKDHTLNQVSLDLIDRDMSQQLNDQRNVEFRLPAAK